MQRVFRRKAFLAAMLGSAAWLPLPLYASSFDPNEGAEPAVTTASAHLPDPAMLYGATPSTPTPNGPPEYISPLLPVAMPQRPLYPEKAMIGGGITPPAIALPAATAAMPDLPPVSPEVQATAKAILETPAAQAPSAIAAGAIAPVPAFELPPPPAALSAGTQPTPAAGLPKFTPAAPQIAASESAIPAPSVAVDAEMPVDLAAPLTIAPPATKLSSQTRDILSAIPSSLAAQKKESSAKVEMDRVNPEILAILGPDAKEEQFDSVGLSIKVRRPGLDANYELNRAYTSLMGGETGEAINIYKDILSADPQNQDALFGLAATYHRQSQIDKARPLYGALLKLNPNHREGLNNFLVLVSDESPQDALPELERLEERNPSFSPIPAQTAIVLDMLGYKDLAREKMLRAIELAPDNLAYKYNLAIMLDRHQRYEDAAALYKVLIRAALQGEKVPASTEVMQKRLNYLTTIASERKALGS